MENEDIKNYITKYLNELLKTKEERQKEIIGKKLEDYIFFQINYEKFTINPKLFFMKTINQHNKSNLCGFYAFFFAKNYLKYIEKGRNLYYLIKNTSNFLFYKFYNKFLKKILEKDDFDEFEKNELKKQGSIERVQIDKILNINKNIYKNEINGIKINYNWIEYSFRNFNYIEINQIEILKNALENFKKSNNEIHIFFIAMQVHWNLLIIDDIYDKNTIFIFDSVGHSDDYINLKDEESLKKYIQKDNEYNQNVLHLQAFSSYQIKMYKEFVYDYQKVFEDFIKVVYNNIDLDEFIIENRCLSIISSFNHLSIEKIEDKTQKILSIYYWLLTEYHPNVLKENVYFLMEKYKINQNNKNKNIQSFFKTINENSNFIEENLNIINENDIKELLIKFINFNKILNDLNK